MENDHLENKSPYLSKDGKIDYFTAGDGTRLRWGYFPASTECRATILLINGHREFLEKYTEFIEDFQRRGFDVYSFDHRGQGLSDRTLSDRKKSHNPDFDKLVSDIDEFIRASIHPETLDHPFYIVAHSLGAHLALRYLHGFENDVDKALLMSPFTDLNGPGALYVMLVKLFFHIMNAVGFSESFVAGQARGRSMIDHELAFSKLTHDRMRYDRSQDALLNNPELFIGGITYGWAVGAVNSLNKLARPGYMERISTPLLCLLSEQERVVNNKTTVSLINRVPRARLDYIRGARHEIYRENDAIRALLWQKIDEFLTF